jgi:3-oxoacyl-[acyl-carrier-protein] synthase-1
MRAALADAGLGPEAVDYLNLHGTGTPGNDAAEDRAVLTVFGHGLPCSSTKGATGHTLGAAGGVEAVLCLLALREGLLPANLNLHERDPQLAAALVTRPTPRRLSVVASNSFGFGGSNACLVFGAAS